MLESYSTDVVWIVIVGFIIAFILAFGVGANDVANSFGTSVGAKVLTLRQACILATVFEILGSILIGHKVSDTVRKGIFNVSMYNNNEKELMLGNMAALVGSAGWTLIATFFSLPVSGTHSIVGAVLGFTLVARGLTGIRWRVLGMIVSSWFLSPVLSGFVSVTIFLGIRHFIIKKEKPLEPGLKSLPFFYGFTILVNIFSIVHEGPDMLHFDRIPWWGAFIIAVALGVIVALLVWFCIVPRLRKKILAIMQNYSENSKDSLPMESLSSTPKSQSSVITQTGTPEFQYSIIKQEDENSKNEAVYTPLTTTDSSKENGHALTMNDSSPASPKSLIPVNCQNGTAGFHYNMMQQGDVKNAKNENLHGMYNPLKKVEVSDDSESKKSLVPEKLEITFVNMADGTNSVPSVCETDEGEDAESKPEIAKLFSLLQVLTAVFGSFAHGGNDVSNAIGPLISLWAIYAEGVVHQESGVSILLLLYGGVGISAGLWIWGRRVIKTLGEDLTKITPASGFTIEIGAATTVLVASKIGLPISTTHCKVGSVVFVGWTHSKKSVDWSLFRNIILAWLLTLPVTIGLSAATMAILYAVAM